MLPIEEVYNRIINDVDVINKIKVSIDAMMKDGKIDRYDVPEIVYVIAITVNTIDVKRFALSNDDIQKLIKLLYNFVVKKYDLIPEDRQTEYESLLDTSLRLVMLQQKIIEPVNKCFSSIKTKWLSCYVSPAPSPSPSPAPSPSDVVFTPVPAGNIL